MEGVLVTGTATAALDGECARCLEAIDDEVTVDLQELFVYDDQQASAHHGDDELEDETGRLEGDLLDLEPLLRDAVVLALPFQPLCEDDCPGLCVECGARLADDPDHAHEAAIDPRWAGLAGARRRTSRTPTSTRVGPGSTAEQHPATGRGENSGSPEAEDVAQQHASPSLAVEGRRAVPGDLRQPGLRRQAPAAPRVRRRAASTAPAPTVARSSDARPGPLTDYGELRAALGDPVLDPELLDRALTHRSYAYENGGLPTNERLEFLGDSVLGVVVTETLYRSPPRPLRGPAGQAAGRGRQRPRAGRGRPGASAWATTSCSAAARRPPAAARRPRSCPTRWRR